MATIYSKVSTQVTNQQPDFIKSDHPDFLAFLKAYYEFLESAELKLKDFGSVDSIIYEEGSTTYMILEDKNRYRQGSSDNILLEDYDTINGSRVRSTGAFTNGETITGQTSKATAIVRTEDVASGSRLFISSQNKFQLNEQVVGDTSGATAYIVSYTANPVQNVMQLLDYMDVDQTIDAFFTQFKEAFMRTIPDSLAVGLNKRNLLKNIKDLYRAKGTKRGHQLFFRILLNEDSELYYPTKDMLRVSDGNWSDDTILRVYATNDTILMEDATTGGGDIFILMEDGSQILNEENTNGTDLLTKLVGQTITQSAVTDFSILSGGAYHNQGYSVINKATAVVDSAFQYQLDGETVTEFVLNPGSVDGTFVAGHNISGTDNTNENLIIKAKSSSVVSGANTSASTYQTSQYFTTDDKIAITADTGNDGSASITAVTTGTIEEIIVDAGGTGYEIGDNLVITNNTSGTALAGEVSIVNGGFVPEDGTLTGEFRVTLESGTPGGPGEMLLEESIFTYDTSTGVFNIGEVVTGLTSGATGTVIEVQTDVNKVFYKAGSGSFTLGETLQGGTSSFKARILTNTVNNHVSNEDDIEMESTDRFIFEGETIRGDTYDGSVIVQEKDTGSGDITDVRVTTIGYGYSDLPTITITSSQGSNGSVKAKGKGVGDIASINIINQGAHYTDQESLKFDTTSNFLVTQISGSFTLNETVIGLASGATARFKSQDSATGIIKMDQLSATPFQENEGIRGLSSSKIALINSYTKTNIPGIIGTVVDRSGKFVNEDGFISDSSKKIQDSYYYQDYSYVVKTATSITNWRDDLLSTVHPGGWAVFGQVDIASKLTQLANITSISALGPAYKIIWAALFGMRLGTVDQTPVNPSPMDEANEPAGKERLYDPALLITSGAAFTLYETITGGTSGATGKVAKEETSDAGVRILTYVPVSGVFQATETITGGGSSSTATVNAVYGLRGKRDRTLTQEFSLDFQLNTSGNAGLGGPTYDNFTDFMFAKSMTESNADAMTFRSHNVYAVQIPYSTLNGSINNLVTTIAVTSATNYPTSGTIQIGSELIDYTGKSTNNLTGCTRGAHSTTAASHTSGARLDSVRWGIDQDQSSGYRIMDWTKDYQGTNISIADFTNYPKRKNNITPPTEVTIYKT
jgi:hypothetical protein